MIKVPCVQALFFERIGQAESFDVSCGRSSVVEHNVANVVVVGSIPIARFHCLRCTTVWFALFRCYVFVFYWKLIDYVHRNRARSSQTRTRCTSR